MHETVSKIKNGVFLPKNIFTSQFQKQKIGITTIDPRMIPPQIDWVFLFNLAVFVLFTCSLFYVCLYRYRNKEKLRKEKELKQQQLVWEFKKALEEQAEQKKQQMQKNRQNTQSIISSNIDNIRLNLENPYLLNKPSNNNTPYQYQHQQNTIYQNNIPIDNGINYDLNFEPSFYPNFSNNYNQDYMQNKNLQLNYNQSNIGNFTFN
jgi:hypothetical protein